MIGDGDNESNDGIGEEDIHKDKEEKLVLALLSELYSELNAILVGTSSTLLVCFTLSTDYLNYQLLF